MPSPLNIPQRFTTDDPVALKGELERMSQEIDTYFRNSANSTVYTPILGKPNVGSLAIGGVMRVNLIDGVTLSLKLPRPDPSQFGKRCSILRSSTAGEILIYGVDALVGGAERYRMANDIHFVEFLLDGDWYPSRAGGGS